MKKISQLLIELWSKAYCPVKHLPVDAELPVSPYTSGCIERMLNNCLNNGYQVRICITLPPDCDRKERIELQSETARPFGLTTDDWEVSEHTALRLINTLSAQQQEISFRLPFMNSREVGADLGISFNAVRKAEGEIHKRLLISRKEEIAAMMITAGFFNAEQLMAHSDFYKAVRQRLQKKLKIA